MISAPVGQARSIRIAADAMLKNSISRELVSSPFCPPHTPIFGELKGLSDGADNQTYTKSENYYRI